MNIKIENFVRSNINNEKLIENADKILDLFSESKVKSFISLRTIIKTLGLGYNDDVKKEYRYYLSKLENINLISMNKNVSEICYELNAEGKIFLEQSISLKNTLYKIKANIQEQNKHRSRSQELTELRLKKIQQEFDEKIIMAKTEMEKNQTEFYVTSTQKNKDQMFYIWVSIGLAMLSLILSVLNYIK